MEVFVHWDLALIIDYLFVAIKPEFLVRSKSLIVSREFPKGK